MENTASAPFMKDGDREADPDPAECNSRPTFEPGDTVSDCDQDNPEENPALVLEAHAIPADEFGLVALQRTVASLNTQYPADDPVIRVVFIESLDTVHGDWEVEEILDKRVDPVGKLPSGIRTYCYPQSRLRDIE